MKKIKHALIALAVLLCMHLNTYAQVWGFPICPVAINGNGGIIGKPSKTIIVNGNPAIVYVDILHTNVYYMRANDANGTSWSAPVIINNDGLSANSPSICIVNGNPAVAYSNASQDLYYVRATDANGTSWGKPVPLDTVGTPGFYNSICVVNGNPAISYQDGTDLSYIRANDANGNTWGSAITIDSVGVVGLFNSMCLVNGNPAIAYLDQSNFDLKYVRASDANGNTWGSTVVVDPNAPFGGQNISMCLVNGNPAVSYYSSSLKYVRATDANGSNWASSQKLDSVGFTGLFPSLCVVSGNPAIAYFDSTNNNLKYIRATDASGNTWANSITLDGTTSNSGYYPSICFTNGYPTISYHSPSGSILKYIRATDATGTTWASPLSFTGTGTQGPYNSICVVNNNPAIAYYDQTNGDLKYARATNTSGTIWGNSVTPDASGNTGLYPSLAIVNSNPAIAYKGTSGLNLGLNYIRATDGNGTTWGSFVNVDATAGSGEYSNLLVVNGNPAIAYFERNRQDLKYVRATDASGTTWSTPYYIDSAGGVGIGASFFIVNGNPAISYYDSTNGDLKYVRAIDASGTTWGTPVTVDAAGNVGRYSCLRVINGNPAISYNDQTNGNLKFIRATDVNGASWGSPLLILPTGNIGTYNSLSVLDGVPVIAYFEQTKNTLNFISATNSSGSSWGTPTTIDVSPGKYTSMITNGTDLFISYFARAFPFVNRATTNKWTGITNTAWGTSTNWSTGTVPGSADNIGIPSGCTNYPNITSGTISCKSIIIENGASMTLNGGTLQLTGEISNSGILTATNGTIVLNGNSVQTININAFTDNTIKNLTLSNSTGATIAGTLNITDTYTPTAGTLTTGGFLTLKSTATGTARIAAGSSAGGYISGVVNTERYIPGKRAFRFLSHPFTTAQSMSALTDDIDITGTGGSPFTSTATNNPSAFYFDVTAGDNSTTGNNPGWTAYTASSTWAQYQAMRVLVRGAKGQGLSTAGYTPSANTIDMSGTVNQGDVTVSLTKGSGTNFVLVGNPFPSQVNMDAVSGTNIGSSFYIWDANQGTRGAYTSYTFGSSSFNLPCGGAFATTLSANGSILFEEADKTNNTAGTMFKTTGIANQVELKLEDSTIFWDRLLLNFDDNAMATVDYPDAAKLYNPDMTFYTLSKDDSMLSIDTRPYVASEVIKLGLYAGIKKNFKFTAPNVNMPAGTKLFFTDKLLSKTIEVTPAFEYWFTVDTSSASWGNNRFELNTQGVPTSSIANVNASKLKVKLVPNPATDNVTLYYEGAGKELNIIVTNMMGVKVATATATNINGNITIPTAQLANGIYNVTIYNGSEVMTQKLIKQ